MNRGICHPHCTSIVLIAAIVAMTSLPLNAQEPQTPWSARPEVVAKFESRRGLFNPLGVGLGGQPDP
jgi:hypothetical protein